MSAWFELITEAEWDPDVASNRLGLQPDDSWVVGSHQVTPTGHVYPTPKRTSGWRLVIDRDQTRDAGAVLGEVLELLAPKANTVTELIDEFRLEAWASVHIAIDDETPTIELRRELLALLGDLRASLEFDINLVELS